MSTHFLTMQQHKRKNAPPNALDPNIVSIKRSQYNFRLVQQIKKETLLIQVLKTREEKTKHDYTKDVQAIPHYCVPKYLQTRSISTAC